MGRHKFINLGFFDRGPLDADQITLAGYWSAYWYRGFIYGTEIVRGLDVLELLPSEFITENEIGAASTVAPATFNAQDQRRVEWPTRPVIARAYLDQLGRTDTLTPERRSFVSRLLDRADAALAGNNESGLTEELATAASDMERAGEAMSGRSQSRLQALADTLTRLATAVQ